VAHVIFSYLSTVGILKIMIILSRGKPLVVLLGVLLTFELLATESILTNSLTVDEIAHLPSGIAYLRDGLYSMYDENPPLARDLMAIPAVLAGAKMNYARAGLVRRWEWNVSQDFCKANPDRYFAMFVWGRFIVVGLSVACGALIFRWTTRLYGAATASICATLWFTDPNVLAHSSVATTDIPATFFGLLATYWFWGYLRGKAIQSAALAGVGLGMAIGTKFTMILLVPAWLIMALVDFKAYRHSLPQTPWRKLAGSALLVMILSLLIVNSLYGFHGTFSSLGSFTFTSPFLSGSPLTEVGDLVGNRFQGHPMGALPIPLPADFLIGFDSQLNEQQIGRFANLDGGKLVAGGFWYSPLKNLLLKTPEGTILLVASLAILWCRQRRLACGQIIILVTPVILLGFLCAQAGGLNFAYRYAIPILPFLIVCCGQLIHASWTHLLGRIFLTVCLSWNAVAVLSSRPSFLSFGNALVGGCDGAQRIFLGSNYDWGQDLMRLKRWVDENPQVKPLVVIYYGPTTPLDIGLETHLPPALLFRHHHNFPEGNQEDFYLAVSSNALHGMPCQIVGIEGDSGSITLHSALLRPENAVARVGRTIYIFRIGKSGSETDHRFLPLAKLLGCLEETGPNDLSGTP